MSLQGEAILDGTGAGTVVIKNDSPVTGYQIEAMYILVNGDTLPGECRVLRSSDTTNPIAISPNARNDIAYGPYWLAPGGELLVTFTGGTPGLIAAVNCTGYSVPSQDVFQQGTLRFSQVQDVSGTVSVGQVIVDQVLLTAGIAQQYNVPVGVQTICLELVGGGGGGAGAACLAAVPAPSANRAIGAGGGGGEYVKVIVPVDQTIPHPILYTIGTGGAGGPATNTNGSAGNPTTAILSGIGYAAAPGSGGANATAGPAIGLVVIGGAGGSSGFINPSILQIYGKRGGTARCIAAAAAAALVLDGFGGSSHMAPAAVSTGVSTSAINGLAGWSYGGGGSGAAQMENLVISRNGGAGAPGGLIITTDRNV